MTSIHQRPVVWSWKSLPSQKEVRLACHMSWVRKLNPRKIQTLAHDFTAGKGPLGSLGVSQPHHQPVRHTLLIQQMHESYSGPHLCDIFVMALTASCTYSQWPWIPWGQGSAFIHLFIQDSSCQGTGHHQVFAVSVRDEERENP